MTRYTHIMRLAYYDDYTFQPTKQITHTNTPTYYYHIISHRRRCGNHGLYIKQIWDMRACVDTRSNVHMMQAPQQHTHTHIDGVAQMQKDPSKYPTTNTRQFLSYMNNIYQIVKFARKTRRMLGGSGEMRINTKFLIYIYYINGGRTRDTHTQTPTHSPTNQPQHAKTYNVQD